MSAYSPPPIQFDQPMFCQIRATGRAGGSWLAQFEGMETRIEASDGQSMTAVLRGELPDQAALAGLLNTLFELHLVVISVECSLNG